MELGAQQGPRAAGSRVCARTRMRLCAPAQRTGVEEVRGEPQRRRLLLVDGDLLCGEVARNALLRHTVEHRSLHRTPIKDDNILGGKDI